MTSIRRQLLPVYRTADVLPASDDQEEILFYSSHADAWFIGVFNRTDDYPFQDYSGAIHATDEIPFWSYLPTFEKGDIW